MVGGLCDSDARLGGLGIDVANPCADCATGATEALHRTTICKVPRAVHLLRRLDEQTQTCRVEYALLQAPEVILLSPLATRGRIDLVTSIPCRQLLPPRRSAAPVPV